MAMGLIVTIWIISSAEDIVLSGGLLFENHLLDLLNLLEGYRQAIIA